MRIHGLLALLVLAAMAQQPPAKTPAAKQAEVPLQAGTGVKFSTTSNLVVVDVTVKDPKTGQTIDNLTEKDFAVWEDGKPQKVAVFEHEKLAMEAEPPPPPPTLDSQLELPEDPKKMITTEGPGKVQYHDKRLLVLFYDFSNMAVPDELRAQDATLKFIDSQMTESDLMAILLFTTTVQVKSDFTADRAQLKSVIENLPIGDQTDLADVADTGDSNEEDTGAAFVADETEFNIFNTDRKLAAIEDAVHKLALLPEKKVLVYVTGGISKTGVDNQAQLEASINAAVKSNVAIYPIDARGLMADPPGGAASKGASRGSGIFNGSQYNAQRASINDSQETLATLAADTGGKVFLDSNDLSLGIVQAQQQFRSYYILGYYTTNTALDGKYRKITVKLKSDIAAKLDFRQGYYANKVWGKFTGADKEMALQQALSAADPATDLPLALEVDYFRISPTAYYVPVSVKIPGSLIALAAKGAGGETEFDFVGNVMDERKAVVSTFRDYIKVKLDAGDKERLATRNFHYDAGCTLEPGRYRIRMLVRENQSGKMGTFDYRFVVPDLAADSMQLKTSSVIWSSQKEPLKAAVGEAEKGNRKTLQSSPLMFGDDKLVPNITKVFRRSQNLYITFDVYDAAPDPAAHSLRKVAVSMSLFNDKGMKAFQASPVEAREVATTRPNAVPVEIQVPLKTLAPGRYTCQLNVMDEVGRKFSFPRQAIVVQ
ncbi:MAG TPA: VWA domain-containing protein [Bryobacteraceae bacterium]|nr:VWA domain-containing protein [Bryobacteraceae bacterium]